MEVYLVKKLTKSSSDKKFGGVLSGLGEYFNIDPTLLRLLFVIFTVFSFGIGGVVAYIIFMIIMPEEGK